MRPGALIPFKNKSILKLLFCFYRTTQLSATLILQLSSDCSWLSQGSVYILKLPFHKSLFKLLVWSQPLFPMLLEWASWDSKKIEVIILPYTTWCDCVCESNLYCLKSYGKNLYHLCDLSAPLFSHCRKGITIPVLIISLWPWVWKKKSSAKT